MKLKKLKNKRILLFKFGLLIFLFTNCEKDNGYVDISNSSGNKFLEILIKSTRNDSIFEPNEIKWDKLRIFNTETGYFISVPTISTQGENKGRVMFDVIEKTISKKYLIYSLNSTTIQNVNNGEGFTTHDLLNYLDKKEKTSKRYSKSSDSTHMDTKCILCHSGILNFDGNLLDEVVINANNGNTGFDEWFDHPDFTAPDSNTITIITDGNNNGKEKITDDELIGKEKYLNDKLNSKGNSFIANLLSKFQGNNSEFDINISSKNKVYKKGTTNEINGKTRYKPGQKTIYIEISTSKLADMPAIAGARTILHEYIHADIFRKLNTQNPSQGDLDFKTTYEAYEQEQQHETMAELYVNSMRDALKSFHENVLVGDYNYLTDNGTNPLPDSFYEGLAWQGLKEHNVQAYENLSDERKTEIKNSIKQYYHSTTKNCPTN